MHAAAVPFFERAASARCPCGIVRCHLRHVYWLRTYNFSNLYNLPLNKIAEAAEPVHPYKNLTTASCLRMEASWRLNGKGDTGSVDPSQAECECFVHKSRKFPYFEPTLNYITLRNFGTVRPIFTKIASKVAQDSIEKSRESTVRRKKIPQSYRAKRREGGGGGFHPPPPPPPPPVLLGLMISV